MAGAQQCAPPTTVLDPVDHPLLSPWGYWHHVAVLPATVGMVQTYRVLDAADAWVRDQGYSTPARPAQEVKLYKP